MSIRARDRRRIGLTWPVVATGLVGFVITPLAWPSMGMAVATVSALAGLGDDDLDGAAVVVGVLGLALGWSLALMPWWLFQRWAGRHIAPVAQGLRVRSWWRTRVVAWDDVESVRSLEHPESWMWHLQVRLRATAGGRGRKYVVALGYSGGPGAACEVLAWAPSGHRLRSGLPVGHRDSTVPLSRDHAARAAQVGDLVRVLRWPPAMVRRRLRAYATVVGLYASLLVTSLLVKVGTAGLVWIAVLGVIVVLTCGRLALLTLRARVELHDVALVERRVLSARVIPSSLITEVIHSRRWTGSSVIVRDAVLGLRDLSVGSSLGRGREHSVDVHRAITAWWEESRPAPAPDEVPRAAR